MEMKNINNIPEILHPTGEEVVPVQSKDGLRKVKIHLFVKNYALICHGLKSIDWTNREIFNLLTLDAVWPYFTKENLDLVPIPTGTEGDSMIAASPNIVYMPFRKESYGSAISFSESKKSLTGVPSIEFSYYAINGKFADCENLIYVGYINASKCDNLTSLFQNCKSLKYIEGINCKIANYTSSMFLNCPNIEYIGSLDGLKKSVTLAGCKKLTHDSLRQIIESLAISDGKQVLSLGSENLAKLSDSEKKIATDKGWTLN